MTHGNHRSQSGSRWTLPTGKILSVVFIIMATLITTSVVKMLGASDQIRAWVGLASFLIFALVSYKLAWANGNHSHGHSIGGHGHSDHRELTKFQVALVLLGAVVTGWLWYRELGPGKEAQNAQVQKTIAFLEKLDSETGALTGKRYEIIAYPLPSNWTNAVPTESSLAPSGFSESIALPSNATFRWDTIGPSGDMLVWDGKRVWMCKEGDKHTLKGATSLAFGSIATNAIKVVVTVKHQPHTY